MTEREQIEIPYFELEPGDNVVAYCETCRKPVFVGNDKSRIGNFVMRGQVISHKDFFEDEHQIDLVYPRKGANFIVDSKVLDQKVWFTSTPPRRN